MTDKDYQALQSAQLLYLWNVMEVLRGTSIAALYLELGILPIQFETEKRQLLFLRRILNKDFDDPGKDFDDPLQLVYNEQLEYEFEKNWANYVRTATYTPADPKSILFDKPSTNSLLFYYLNISIFWKYIDKLRFWHLI